ncbi:fungal-specific transcription factor domain-containing protein [Phanerochaete sordida]|uniref:Fungal-specific transcription factor domain-containing protein n=1 Tax=Phanerochaete sordida TaxID=48140 RepID=A0A9P3GAI4_9APHY|nr:fungal-specific transcription factor domain-containing protein [Phanerochaete sordida]
MSDRPQYHFADDLYSVQRTVTVDSPSNVRSAPSPYDRDPEPIQRKRGKFTRSKTGCLTCRTKKVKCDEEKPDCKRCRDTQRKCTWPEIVPTRKRPPRKDSRQSESPLEVRPSTAGSSGLSEVSTPPPRTHSPPKASVMTSHSLPHMSSLSHSQSVPQPSLTHRHTSSSSMSSSHQRQQMMMGPTTTLPYPLQPHVHAPMVSGIASIPSHQSAHSAHSSYPYRYPPTQPHYVQQQQYPPMHGLSRVTTHHNEYGPVKLEDPGDSPVKFEDHGDDWHPSHYAQHVDPIQPFFPTMQERDLIRHYCHHSLRFMMAVPSENPVLAANLQIVLSRAPGLDLAIDSLRKALLGTAATHRSFLASRTGDAAAADDSRRLANAYRAQAVRLLNKACISADGVQSDATIAAVAAVAQLDILAGGHDWAASLDLALTVINTRGGPAVLLARSARPQPGTISGVSRARLFLELVAMYDLFGCLGTGRKPTLLHPDAHGWWTQAANNDDGHSHIDKCFGISRTLVPLLSRAVSLAADVLAEPPDALARSADARLMHDARALLDALEHWAEPAPARARITAGNCIYRAAAQIMILRDVFGVPPADAAVQRLVDVVLSLAANCGAQGMSIDLNWPVIIAGSQTFGADRGRVHDIFSSFREQCCFELQTSAYIILQVWKRLDSNLPGADWRSVIKDEGIDVLIV